MKPPNKYEKAYVANHLYYAFGGKWPERDWEYAILVTDPLYFAFFQHIATPDNSAALWRILMDLHDV